MTELVHDAPGERFYEYGSSKAVLFPHTGGAYVWNGFEGVNINPVTQNESEKWYFDGVPYYEKIEAEEFGADIQCVNTPKAFLPCEGVYESTDYPGMYTHMNPRIKFNLAWVTQIGNDESEELAYRLHIVYNAQAQPAGRSYQTRTDISTPESRSISIKTTPACGIWSYYSFDSREADVDALLATILGGTLPACNVLSVGPPPPPNEEIDCISMTTNLENYNPGQILDEDFFVEETQTIISGTVNNGFDVIELSANGAFEDNDSAALPTVVGSGAVLSDDDDATYITSDEGDLGYTVALEPLTGGYEPGANFELHIRMSITGDVNPEDPDNLSAEAQVQIADDAAGELATGGFSDGAQEGMAFKLSDVTGEIVDYVVPLKMDAWINSDITAVWTSLSAGAYLNILGASNFNPDPALLPVEVRVYEAKVVMINATDSERYLRVTPGESPAVIEQHVRTTEGGSTDATQAYTSFVDFKVKLVPYDSSFDGEKIDVVKFDADVPGTLKVELNGDRPRVLWYDDGSVTADVIFEIDYQAWYRIRVYKSFGVGNVKVWRRDASSEYLLDRDLTYSENPSVEVKHFAGMAGNLSELKTIEVVIDNAYLYTNCFEEAPLESLTFDLGMRNVQLDFTPFTSDFDGLSSPDTSSEMVIPNGSHAAYSGDVYFAEESHGDGGYPNVIFLPDVSDDYVLTQAQYVVIAYREGDDGFTDWDVDYGPPTDFPFLYIDSSGTSDYHSFFPLPIGGYSGEIVSTPDSELLSRIVESGSVAHARMWFGEGADFTTPSPIHVAYFALRLRYDPA